jgi:hypothetical protein
MLHIKVDIVFSSADGRDIHSAELDTFSLTITMSTNGGPSLTGVVNTPSPTAAHIPVAEGSAVRLTVLKLSNSRHLPRLCFRYLRRVIFLLRAVLLCDQWRIGR